MAWKTLGKILFAVVLMSAVGCKGKETEVAVDDSDVLYRSTLEVIDKYTEVMNLATDSAALEEGFERFQNDMDSINRMVAPDTDFLLTENRNDTVYMRVMALVELYEKKRRNFVENSDTVAIELKSSAGYTEPETIERQ